MNQEEIKKLEEERQVLLGEIQRLDEEKNKRLTRVIETQGIICYLNNKTKEK